MGKSDAENLTDASREKRILDLAALDWAGKNVRQFAEFAGVGSATLSNYRNTDIYKTAISEFRQEWHEQMLKLPQTNELRKRINHAMSLSINVLIEILSGNSEDKDKLAAARLASQLDGRFLKGEGDEDDTGGKGVDSIANELLIAIKRHSETVN
jgi:hypothetical protein